MNFKKIISGILAALLLGTTANPVYAAEKEEVIYVTANADGSIKSIYVVNSFWGGEVTDYGEYSQVKLMNIDGDISQNGDEISFSSPENEKVYYQGTMENAQLPWVISIRYFLDGKELSAEEIAGKSGALEIKISITENEECKGDFCENYALQCSFTLDTEICRNITADGATLANVGSKKQITYTALAGSGLERSITANVTDFEMPSAQINGIRMNIGLDIDYDGSIADLIDGVEQLDDGAQDLYNGSVKLNDGVSELNKGIETLRDGIDTVYDALSELNGKSADLKNGSAEVKNALLTVQSSLSAVSVGADKLEQLTAASAEIKAGIDRLCKGIEGLKNSVSFDSYKAALGANGLDIDTLKSGNEQTITQLSAQIYELKATLSQIQNVPQYSDQAAELTAQITQLETIVQLLSGNNAVIGGTEAYLNASSEAITQLEAGANELKVKYAEFDTAINVLTASLGEMLVNMSALAGGIDTLVSEYEKLDSGIIEYTDGVGKLYSGFAEIQNGAKELARGGITLAEGTEELVNGTVELADGTSELRNKTNIIDSTATAELDNMLSSISKEYDTVSFVSDKNTEVSSVQFVITTKAVEIPEAETVVKEQEEELNFWQKLLRLFGLY